MPAANCAPSTLVRAVVPVQASSHGWTFGVLLVQKGASAQEIRRHEVQYVADPPLVLTASPVGIALPNPSAAWQRSKPLLCLQMRAQQSLWGPLASQYRRAVHPVRLLSLPQFPAM